MVLTVGADARRWAAGAAAVLAMGAPATASAQGLIGTVIATEIGQQAAMQAAEDRCRKGVPATPKVTAQVKEHMEEVVGAYFALPANADENALGKVFLMKASAVRWRDESGETPITALGPHLGGPVPQLTLLASAVAGDGQSGRAIWTASAAAPGAEALSYAVDVVHLGRDWRILRMAVLPASKAPGAPEAYCHYHWTRGY